MTAWILLVSFLIHAQIELDAGDSELNIEKFLDGLWLESTSLGTLDDQLSSTTRLPQPFFETPNVVNITAQLGTFVILHCKVCELTDRTTVSWLRKKGNKLDLLSVGLEIYANDGRYSTSYKRPNDWQLHLTGATEYDEGHYECQVSSHPPIVHTVYLHVIVPELEILDERGLPIKNKFYNFGSTIELKCIISKVPQPTQFIMWRLGERVLNYDTMRGGISVKTDIMANGARSRLFIANANVNDSGNYTCSLLDAAAASVIVHVLNDESPAAMQHGGSPGKTKLKSFPLYCIFLLVIDYIR